MELMGIGRKVADCICLFSLSKFDVIPGIFLIFLEKINLFFIVDTHVWKIAQIYIPKLINKKLNDSYYEEIGDFFKKKFGNYCGWAHTILFASDLTNLKKEKENQELTNNNFIQKFKKRKFN